MLHVLPSVHVDNQNDTVNPSTEAQEIVEENFLEQGNSNDMYCKEMDILTDSSFEISCGIEMSSDEEDMDIDLQDKLDAAEEKRSIIYMKELKTKLYQSLMLLNHKS